MTEGVRNEIAELRAQLEQLRHESSRSAAMAAEIMTAFGEAFRRARRASSPEGAAVTVGERLTLPLGVKEQLVALAPSATAQSLSATALCGDSSQVVVVRLRFARGAEPLRLLAGERTGPSEFVVRLAAGEATILFEIEARTEPLEVSLCRVGGELCAVRLHVDGGVGATSPRDVAAAADARAHRSSSKGALWKAQQLLREGRPDRAMEVALAYATEVERPALALLRATLAKDDSSWLSNVNAYVEQFDIAPIRLHDGPEPRFLRLTAGAPRATSAGPLVTVIMPAFNAEKTLELAAGSILSQSWTELELIIVDDCSTDHTWEAAQRVARLDPRTTVLRNDVNVGPYVSKNIALSVARGAYITCHDADDWAHPQRIENQVALLQGNGARACVASWLRLDEMGAFCGFTAVGRNSHDGALRLAHITCMIDSKFMKRYVGHWDSVRFGADGEMLERLERLLGDEFLRLPSLSVLSLDAPSSLTNDVVHGISKVSGLSPTRRAYRDAWRRWHSTLTADSAYCEFPPRARPFTAPQEYVVPASALDQIPALMTHNR